jgi:hypothetical protein
VLEAPGGETLSVVARTYIDGTYEGDLAAAAGVPCRVGREGREEYGESLAGIHYMDWVKGEQILTPDTGEPSPAIQAFCARSIFTDDPDKLVPLEKPDTYEQHLPDLLPLLDDFASGHLSKRSLGTRIARRKFQLNGSIDVHPCHDRRFAVEGWMEGVLWYPKKADGPAQPGQVPYGAMLPERLDNLLVPVALSCTHIAMSVLRMEPLWMTTGQVAGLAAAVARESGIDVANLDPDPLPKILGILSDPYG